MNLYKISQTINGGYDTFDAAIVAAESENEARDIHPNGEGYETLYGWCSPEYVKVELLCENYRGSAGVILASYNAG